jgi:hypothetical protein
MTITQTPTELLDYTINWPSRGLPTGATIASQTVVASDASVVISGITTVSGATQSLFYVTGGVAGNTYQITTEITLSTSQKMDYTVNYNCIANRTA